MCDLCDNDGTEDALSKLFALQNKAMDAHGWVVHAVENQVHSHGLVENYAHPDLQMVGFSHIVAHGLLVKIVEQIKSGAKYEAGKEYEGIADPGWKVRFELAIEGNREVLRVIVPDENGKTLREEMTEQFKLQWDGVLQRSPKFVMLDGLSRKNWEMN